MLVNKVKQLLCSGKGAVNAWVSLDSTHVAEVLSYSGFDSVTVDLQHGMFGLDSAISMLRAVSAGNATPLARSSQNNASEIGKLLDAGAVGIICPGVDTPEQAQHFVDACRYPTLGSRSFGPARALLYGGSDYVARANDELLTLAMIESPTAVSNLDDILDTESLDGIYIGPNDLAFAMGTEPSGSISSSILTIMEEVTKRVHERGMVVGGFAKDGLEGVRLKDIGIDLITPGNDVGMISASAAERINQVRHA